ncbi:LAME_0A07910g1_1 [Lachancea meyersii CBS 8951]|uniref:LAME_0A07910g1_1 n=1 Tax=Lachancea meyersii CBS 8951 TaxID=1266667 RepID=A0A1G4IRN1_9SACH|nr:LAME_0A07910g1_1 [Lachancea meyersii CBS 8951]
MAYPKISIRFCTRCKWNLRSAWYLQELLQTFQDALAEVSLIPGEAGEFQVLGYIDANSAAIVLWDRKIDGGFPDSKFLKQRVKERVLESSEVGAHLAREVKSTTLVTEEDEKEGSSECHDCA